MVFNIYTDASLRYGHATIAIFCDSYEYFTLTEQVLMSTYQGSTMKLELSAIEKALTLISGMPRKKSKFQTFNIYSDNGIAVINAQDSSQKKFIETQLQATVNVKYVKGHSGVHGNTVAHRMAYKAHFSRVIVRN
ncbi:uncharacterized protein SAPINGB_P005916 [Magnusiomyces paraingens]|uniref:RNase H type-1 domain-containing protein n=1 Tax=Magnusiomyces paraingens TaxID=2606893 RepID=A0A5E8C2V2_9ASCO|nr:uncharacterized protein SAPINGB_P005916 [Saprochaete ingens]VVT57873.1 unnamed protein product [Saprochaete ingens]